MISINDLVVTFGGSDLFSEVNFHVGDRDKIGLVGKNGSGKSTILKILAGVGRPSSGKVMIPSSEKIGYLPQEMEHNKDKSVIEEAMLAFSHIDAIKEKIDNISLKLSERNDYESYSYQKLIIELNDLHDKLTITEDGNPKGTAEKTLFGLGFRPNELDRSTSTFSQGWNMRIELAKILLSSPTTLLLDEPTNHLDIESIQWLEEYLSSYQGALILVSHDRRFLDSVTNRTVEIMLGKIHDYKVPYSKYLILRKERMEQQRAAFDNQQRLIEKSEEFIERFRYKATKSNQVQSRIKQLDKIDRIEVEEEDKSSISVKFPPAPRSGNVVLKTKGLGKSYGEKTVFKGADVVIERGEKIALVGRNGEGKTTFMRLLSKEINPSNGVIELGHNVSLGYYAQNQDELLDSNDTVFETLEKVAVGDVRTRLRDILGAFLFKGEDIDKKVSVLSGGEKSRLAMAKLILKPYNLLALDEPTNHMDIKSKDILKQALLRYNGTLLVVSHDRDFLDGLVNKVLEFKDGRIREHIGSVSDYLERRRTEEVFEENVEKNKDYKSAQPVKNSQNDGREKAKEERRKRQQIERCESLIHECETEIANVEIELAELKDNARLNELINNYNVLKERLSKLMDEWESLHN